MKGRGLKAKLARLGGAGPGARPPTAAAEPGFASKTNPDHGPCGERPPEPDGPRRATAAPRIESGPCGERPPEPDGPRAAPDAGEALAEALRGASHEERIETLRAAVSALVSRGASRCAAPPARAPTPSSAPGEPRETPHGRVHVVETYLEPSHHHGCAPIARALEVEAAAVAQLALDPSLAEVDLRRALYIDTETTGLAGGTGTVPFLIGMAWFEDESLRVIQLFLPELGREGPMLAFLAERIAISSCIISYNGKAFDWPLLRTRFVMNRVKAPPLPPHLDLLHCARRAFKARIASLRLCEMERELLSMIREHDVDGAEIPGIYLTFLRTGIEPRLSRIIEHNANDLVALAALLGELGGRYAVARGSDDPRDHLAFAKIAHRAGDLHRARDFAGRAATGGGPAQCTVEARLLEARLLRKSEDRGEEERALLAALEAAEATDRPRVALALAKLYEHRVRDLRRALDYAAQSAPAEGPEANERRLARLERRIEARALRG